MLGYDEGILQRISVKLKHAPYQVVVERGLLAKSGKLIAKLLPSRSAAVFVVASPTIWQHWGARLEESLASAKLKLKKLELADGERAKTLDNVERLAEQLAAAGADRQSVVVAFGGGVVGDAAGFLASIYMRGIPVVQVPTTLLAQIDAAIGGKTGVNLRTGKNLIGTFHQPKAVLVDPEVLRTLPEREFRSGLFEAIKYGVIRDKGLFETLAAKRHSIMDFEAKLLEQVIGKCVRIKAQVVAADEREGDLRRILNFGHTIGHALEAETGYKHFLHGEAVGWGMAAAAMLAAGERRAKPEVAQKIVSAVLTYSPLPPVTVRGAQIVQRIRSDKKTVGGKTHFVLPVEIGKVTIRDDVPELAVERAVEELRYLSRA